MIKENQYKNSEENNSKGELVIYDIVSRNFRQNSNAGEIAEQHGCEFEFRNSELPHSSYKRLFKRATKEDRLNIWKVWNLTKKGTSISLVLKGENLSQLLKASDKIYEIYGEVIFDNGLVYPLPEEYVLGKHVKANRYN